MSAVLVTGGSGVLGRYVVTLLRERGREVRVLSRQPGRGTHVAEDFVGPEVLDLRRIVEVWRARHHRPRAVVGIPVPGRFSAAFRRGANTAPERTDGRQTWEQFVQAQTNHR